VRARRRDIPLGRHLSASGVVIVSSLLLAACTSADSGANPTTSSPSPTPVCAEGAQDRPTAISRLALDGVTAETFQTTLTVPYAGLEEGPLDRPSVIRVSVVTAESGAPVTFRSDTGRLVESLAADWLMAPSQVTVYSAPGSTACTAAVYLLGTVAGPMTLTAESADTLTAFLDVEAPPSAARDVSVSVQPRSVLAGAQIEVTVAAQDVFGNPIANSAIVIGVPRDGPAVYLNGANRATVLTDQRGRASVQLVTRPDRGSSVTIRVRGDNPVCAAEVNQYACVADQPFLGAPKARGSVKQTVEITQPAVTIETPRAGRRLSAGEAFDLRALALGVESGTLAQVKLGDAVLALGSVEEEGALSMRSITAQPGEDYGLLVGTLARVPLKISVLPFGITDARAADDRLRFTIATGAWGAGTTLSLQRNGERIEVTTLDGSGAPWSLVVPGVIGTYTVTADEDGRQTLAPDPLVWS
jgi:hypothetical protein